MMISFFYFYFCLDAHCAKVLICTVKSVKKQRWNILEPVKKRPGKEYFIRKKGEIINFNGRTKYAKG